MSIMNLLYALFILFLALKLTHYIDWSWLFVFAPIYTPVILSIIIGAITFIVYVIIFTYRDLVKRRKGDNT